MNIFEQGFKDVESFLNPSNEQKAYNAVSSLLSVAQTADVLLDPLLALYAPLKPLADLLDQGIAVIQAAKLELASVIAKQKAS